MDTRWIELCHEGSYLTEAERKVLERQVAETPDDLESRARLIGAHYHARMNSARATHIVHLISVRPAISLGPYGRLDPEGYPAEYQLAKTAWALAIDTFPRDVAVLENAGEFLLESEPLEAASIFRRAAELQPEVAEWHELLARSLVVASRTADTETARRELAEGALAAYENALQLDTQDFARFTRLNTVARAALAAGKLDRAAALSKEALQAAERNAKTFQYGNAVHWSHIVLGHVALVRADAAAAERHLLLAGQTPGSPQLNSFGPDLALATELLSRGHRDRIAEYLRACAQLWSVGAAVLRRWAAEIESGATPSLSREGLLEDSSA